ncbi:MAG: formate hydrogenase [Acidobacteria bacterium]|nr:formate hydrogenase [Acidobacteriota bacterium]
MTNPRTVIDIDAGSLHTAAQQLFDTGFTLTSVSAHDDGDELRVVYTFLAGPHDQRHELVVRVDKGAPSIPSLSDLSFPASRFEREVHDFFGIVPTGHRFLRPLAMHQHWPTGWYAMRHDAGPMPAMRDDAAPYPFVEVQGSGVYEIPVGPIHAGLIEPGHFRFSVVGETILKMTARLWYVHRGIERLLEGADPARGLMISERVSGDSAVGHSLAFAMAVEDAMGLEVSSESRVLRAVLLELERLYNHVSDIGAMCNDVGFGVAQGRALVLREYLLRLNEAVTGHRLLRGAIALGATRLRCLPRPEELHHVAQELENLVALALSNTVLVDRFEGTAVLGALDAHQLGTLGPVARSSGRALDARAAHGFVENPAFHVLTQTRGDVMARFTQRVEEARMSIAMILEFLDRVRELSHQSHLRHESSLAGLGIVEGWRGMIVHRVEVDTSGIVTRCHIVDPSFNNWPALAVSLADTIVPDFPLANKSFNLSYAGNDL